MYLSRLILNSKHKLVRRDIGDCAEMHRTIMSTFPDVSGDMPARARLAVLYRLETRLSAGEVLLYVQSREAPDWSKLPAGYVLKPPESRPVDAIYGRLQEEMVLRFRLRANPTRKVDTKSLQAGVRRNGRRVEFRSEDGQVLWLKRKAAANGFEIVSLCTRADVPDVRATREPSGYQHRRLPDGGRVSRALTLAAVLFDGHLKVTDPARFRQALEAGIGPGKAYGFGLLSIAPPTR